MSSRRQARGGGRTAAGSIPKCLFEYAKSGGFWDTKAKVLAWCAREGLDAPPEQYFRHPPGLRQWCIDAWATRQGFITRCGRPDMSKIRDLGIWRGYGSSSVKAHNPEMFRPADLDAWRPRSAPG